MSSLVVRITQKEVLKIRLFRTGGIYLRFSMGTLWRNADFLKLWSAETVSLFGSQITVLALPLTAVLTFHASAAQVGILQAAGFAPFLLFTLFLGVWIDRHNRRPVLIFSNAGRAILLGLIPLGAFFHLLRIEYLYLIAFLAGILTVFFQLAYQAYLPSLIEREHLTEGNSKLSISASVAEVAGPGVGGFLVQVLSAPIAILVDVFSFLFSAIVLFLIHKREPAIEQPEARRDLLTEIKQGFAITFRNPYLRAIAGEAATFNLFFNWMETVYVLFVLQDLHLTPAIYGLILAIGGIGSVLGALLAEPLGRRWGIGPALVGVMVVACLLPLLIPLAGGQLFGTIWLSAIGFFLNAAVVISNVFVVSLRQAVTSDRLLGRMNASYRFFTWGFIPLGSLIGGSLGSTLGLRPTLIVGTIGIATACLWVVFSPVRRLRQLSANLAEPDATSPSTMKGDAAQTQISEEAIIEASHPASQRPAD